MTPSSTCDVCGTVNVLQSGRCIACGQPLAAPSAPVRSGPASHGVEDSSTATTGPHADAAGEPAAAAEPTPEGCTAPIEDAVVAEARAASAHAPLVPVPVPAPSHGGVDLRRAAEHVDLDDSALRGTVVEVSARAAAESPAPPARAPRSTPQAASRTVAAPASPDPRHDDAEEIVYLVRLLLPEGDKRGIEVGRDPVKLGSGLDEIGLAGDPKIRPSEGTMFVEGGKLWLDVAPGSTGIYRRIDGEEDLHDGDVVLIGDIAAVYAAMPAPPPLSPDDQVLGGASGNPAGRLVFLRRDGSPGPVHDLPAGRTILGRTDGHLNFPTDSRLSRRHARFNAADGKVTVDDLDSRNGTYMRVRSRQRLDTGDALRIGSAGVQIRSGG